MRCLRCAIDYGPDEQFCQRCGRALSRPLGSRASGDDGAITKQQETQFLYTTTAPPPLQGSAQGTGEPVDWEAPASSASSVSSPVLEPRPDTDLAPDDALDAFDGLGFPTTAMPLDSSALSSEPAQADPAPSSSSPVDLPSPAGLVLKRVTGSLATPAQDETDAVPAAPSPLHERVIAPPSDDFFGDEDEADGPGLFSAGSSRQRQGGQTGTRVSLREKGTNKRRALPLVIIIAVVILALGGYAYTRQRAYNRDLANAQNLALKGDFTGAIYDYNQAIADWPFNSGAKNGLAAAQAAESAARTAAQAAAQVQAQYDATRQAMYDAHLALIQQEIASQP